MSQPVDGRVSREIAFLQVSDMAYQRVDRVRLNGHELVNISQFTCHPNKQGTIISMKIRDVKWLIAALALAAETELPSEPSAKPPAWKVPYSKPAPPAMIEPEECAKPAPPAMRKPTRKAPAKRKKTARKPAMTRPTRKAPTKKKSTATSGPSTITEAKQPAADNVPDGALVEHQEEGSATRE